MATTPPESLLLELQRLESVRDPHLATQTRRQFARYVVRGDAQLHPISRARLDITPIDVQLRDIGPRGIGFLSSESLEVNSRWRACFLSQGYVIGEQEIVICHCDPVSDSVHLVGGQLVMSSSVLLHLGIDPELLPDVNQAHTSGVV